MKLTVVEVAMYETHGKCSSFCAATIRTRVGWAAIRAACVAIPLVYLLLVESSIGAHALKSFMADRVYRSVVTIIIIHL